MKGLQARTLDFASRNGRRPRVLLAELEDGKNSRKIKIFALGFADGGFDVDISPRGMSLKGVARMAVESDVHGVGLLNSFHDPDQVPALVDLLEREGVHDIAVFTDTKKMSPVDPDFDQMVDRFVKNILTRIGG